jgi:hypothetical protein
MFQTSVTYELAKSIHDYDLENAEEARRVRKCEDFERAWPARAWFPKLRRLSLGFGSRPAAANCR